MQESCEFMPFLSPQNLQFLPNSSGVKKIRSIEFIRTEMDDDGNWIEDPEQTVVVKANFVISAFGSGLNDDDG